MYYIASHHERTVTEEKHDGTIPRIRRSLLHRGLSWWVRAENHSPLRRARGGLASLWAGLWRLALLAANADQQGQRETSQSRLDLPHRRRLRWNGPRPRDEGSRPECI